MGRKRKHKRKKAEPLLPVTELAVDDLWAELCKPQRRPKPNNFNARRKAQEAIDKEHRIIECILEADPWQPVRIVYRITIATCEYCHRTHKMLPTTGPMMEFYNPKTGCTRSLLIQNPNNGGLGKYKRELHTTTTTITCCPLCFKEKLYGDDSSQYISKRISDHSRVVPEAIPNRNVASGSNEQPSTDSGGLRESESRMGDTSDILRTAGVLTPESL